MSQDHPRAVVLDLGGVLCEFRPERRLEALAAATGLDSGHIEEAIWQSGLDDAGDRGEVPRNELYRRVIEALGGGLTEQRVRQLWSTAFEPNEAVLDIARSLHCQRALLTNNGPIVGDCVEHELSSVRHALDRVFLSFQFGGAKPDAVVFAGVEQALSLEPRDLVFVDDDPANAGGAAARGWTGIVFDDAESLAGDLRAIGVPGA